VASAGGFSHRGAAAGRAQGGKRHGAATPLLEVTKLIKEYPRKGLTKAFAMFKKKPAVEPETFKAVDGILHDRVTARASAWSANPGAASRPRR